MRFRQRQSNLSRMRKTRSNAYESGWTDTDRYWLLDLFQLRHFDLENSGIIEGCTNYNLQYTVAIAEEGVRRVILTTAQELFEFVPIAGEDALLPVCSGDMLFNVFDEYLGFLK